MSFRKLALVFASFFCLTAIALSQVQPAPVALAAQQAAGEACPHDAQHDGGSRARAAAAHQHEPAKASEHAALLDLVPECQATHVAVRSGSWLAEATWRDAAVPVSSARILIPAGISVEVDAEVEAVTNWVRVEGTLRFRADRNTALRSGTVVVAEEGLLEIGASSDPVRADVRARLLFTPRRERNRQTDPYDLSGGLLSHGIVRMFGTAKTPHRRTVSRPIAGTTTLAFAEAVDGWRRGDQLLIPGTHTTRNEDERRTIARMSGDSRTVTLDRPLAFDHPTPSGVAIPIGNLTRNIEVRSLAREPLSARGHVMIVHAQTGTVFDGVAFVDLGRTDTRMAHTVPEVGDDGATRRGSDLNTIGRYAVHFHVVSGARIDRAPHVVRNSSVVGSPKYGIVNHGGFVIAENNVTFDIAGAHLVAENGGEIGAFRHNMSVRSSGSGDAPRARMFSYDFAHGGHGIWLQSSAVEATDNWVSGHGGSAIMVMTYPMRERDMPQGEVVHIDAANVGNPPYAGGAGRLLPDVVNFHLARNVAAASKIGLEVWDHKLHATHGELSVVEDFVVWNVQFGVHLPYAKFIAFRNVRILSTAQGQVGLFGNATTEYITFDGGTVNGFSLGMRLQERGPNIVRDTSFSNVVDVEIPRAVVAGRHLHLDHLTFRATGDGHSTIRMLENDSIPKGDATLMFLPDRIDLTDRQGRNRRLFFPTQRANAIPFADGGPKEFRGLTSAAIRQRFGLQVGGALASSRAAMLASSNALAETQALLPAGDNGATGAAAKQPPERASTGLYADRNDGWAVLQKLSPTGAAALEYKDTTPPKFMIARSLLPLQIHPNDVPFGYLVQGSILDEIAGVLTATKYAQPYHQLRVDADGVIRIPFKIADHAGNETPVQVEVRVTTSAIQRGPNLDFFMQRWYCGACGSDTVSADQRRFFDKGEISPLPRVAAAR